MIDLGIATSVAKKQNYSWQITTNLAKSLNLKAIQYYLPENCVIPQVDKFSYFTNIYLHIPNSYHLNEKPYLKAAKHFRDEYSASKLILHQKEDLSIQRNLELITHFTQNGFEVGVENEGKTDLYSYIDLVKFHSQNNLNIIAVIDIHRFYNNFHRKFDSGLIFDMILLLFDLCSTRGIQVVLHLIDSKSYGSDRKYWTPIMQGILPYTEIFTCILKKQIKIESIILEYESDEYIKTSIINLRKTILYFGRN